MAKCKYDWKAVAEYHRAGHSRKDCERRFGFTTQAWYKAIYGGRLNAGVRAGGDGRRKYDWAAIQVYYDAGHTVRACMEHFGFATAAWNKAVTRGEVKGRPIEAWSVERVLRESRSRHTVKRTLLAAGILKNRCDECGLTDWRGKPLSIQIDHVNGVRDDHRLENLRMLCPNCHSQTDTYGARNRGRLKALHGGPEAV